MQRKDHRKQRKREAMEPLLQPHQQPKEGEGSKAGEFNASKRRFDNFRKSFALKSVKITGKVAPAIQEAADEFPDTIEKIIEEKIYLPEQAFNAGKSLTCHQGHVHHPAKPHTLHGHCQRPRKLQKSRPPDPSMHLLVFTKLLPVSMGYASTI
ncbi:hypothetical protein QTO34_008493 [Cnephaeus nilssonii]|uniref:Uncharacterized protein n=1 Tax=Cnephaeus nilssonii TaxID=3371016 RepID=A0AA40IAD5_CNENI|nr:hypothetical protein QTO34_008493 [Eptesicus nilssonii]